ATAQDEARLQARQRPGANEELLQRPLAAPPGPLVAKTQTVAVKVTLAASHRTGATGDRPGRGTPRCPIELLLGHPRRHPRPPAGRAAALETTRRRRTARSATRPRGGSVAAQIAAEQPHRLVPFPWPPGRVDVSSKPRQPAGVDAVAPGLFVVRNQAQHRLAHR